MMKPTSVFLLFTTTLGVLAAEIQHPLKNYEEPSYSKSSYIIVGKRGWEGRWFEPNDPPAIRVLDSNSPDLGHVWEWTPSSHIGSIPISVANCVTRGPSVTEVKWASNGTRISAVIGSAALVINYTPGTDKDKTIAFATCVEATHTVEVIPGDLLAVATTGKTQKDGIKIYNMAKFPVDNILNRDPLPIQTILGFPAVHGLLWDETDHKLWAVGNKFAPDGNQPSQALLRGYPYIAQRKQGGWNPINDAAVETYNISIPQKLDVEWSGTPYVNWWNGPHDLVGVPHSRTMLITTDLDIHVFDIEKSSWIDNKDVVKQLFQGFRARGKRVGAGGTELPRSDIKAISVNAEGWVLYVQAFWKDWFGDNISIIGTIQHVIDMPQKLYKARWFSEVPGWPTAVNDVKFDGLL
ncbi:hypothetical protein SCUP234_07101 [Seiridium cupressi]